MADYTDTQLNDAIVAQSARIDALAVKVDGLRLSIDAATARLTALESVHVPGPIPTPVPTPIPTPIPTPTPTPTPTPVPPVSGLGTGDRPFSAASRWNTTVGTVTEKPALTSAFRSYQANTWMNCDSYSIPVFVATTSDPLVTITQPYGRPSVTARVPSAAVPAAGTDSNMAIIQPDGTVVDVWVAKWTGPNTINAGRVNKTRLDGDGFGPQAGIRGSGASTLGGLINPYDIKQGRIDHALAMAVPTPMLKYTTTRVSDGPDPSYMRDGTGTSLGWVAPATEQDYNAAWVYKGQIPMGSKLVLPRSVDIESLGINPSAKLVAQALQNHGAYILDTTGDGGSVSFYAEPSLASSSWYVEVTGPSWTAASLAKIRQQLVVVA